MKYNIYMNYVERAGEFMRLIWINHFIIILVIVAVF